MTRPLRLPVAPARRALTTYARERHVKLEELGNVLHLPEVDVPALIERRWLSWHVADVVAIALGYHPYELWPEWFDPPDQPTVPTRSAGRRPT